MNWLKLFQTQHTKVFSVASATPAHQAGGIRQQIVVLRDKGASSRAAYRSLRHLVSTLRAAPQGLS